MSFEFRTDRARIAIRMTRKAGMSKEDFRRYWTEVHGPRWASLDIVKASLLKYEQAHVNMEMADRLRAAGCSVPDYDGFAIFEAANYETLLELMQSEEFKIIVMEDAPHFVDSEQTQFIPLDLITPIDKVLVG
ncbi:hypothetical protein DFH06DRAFT_1317397 [Mycena polygramma]|nr:hypothetical protein DFH06DRAFT_1317397 [Mycena polygramma]